MPNYRYVPGENPCFMSDKMSKIGKDVTVRFVVIATKWLEDDTEFLALVSLEGLSWTNYDSGYLAAFSLSSLCSWRGQTHLINCGV
jgi:hypothetical protein